MQKYTQALQDINMKAVLFLTGIMVFATSLHAANIDPEKDDVGMYEADAKLDLDSSWIDPYELVRIKSYDQATRTYEVIKVEDPTIEQIYATPESLVKCVPLLNEKTLNGNPGAIVGHEYTIEKELVLIEDSDRSARQKQTSVATNLAQKHD